MREARKRRIGRWIPQEPRHCWLASVCIATGYKYSRARQERYQALSEVKNYVDVTEATIDALEEPLSTIWRSHHALAEATGWGHRMRIPAKGHGVISMYTRRYQHSVAIIDGIFYLHLNI